MTGNKRSTSYHGKAVPPFFASAEQMARETYGYEAIESSGSAFNMGSYTGVQLELQINTDIFITL